MWNNKFIVMKIHKIDPFHQILIPWNQSGKWVFGVNQMIFKLHMYIKNFSGEPMGIHTAFATVTLDTEVFRLEIFLNFRTRF